MRGVSPDLDVAFDDAADCEAARDFMDMVDDEGDLPLARWTRQVGRSCAVRLAGGEIPEGRVHAVPVIAAPVFVDVILWMAGNAARWRDPLRTFIADDLHATAQIKSNPSRTAKRPIDWRLYVGPGPGLVDEDEALGIKQALVLLPLIAPTRDLGS